MTSEAYNTTLNADSNIQIQLMENKNFIFNPQLKSYNELNQSNKKKQTPFEWGSNISLHIKKKNSKIPNLNDILKKLGEINYSSRKFNQDISKLIQKVIRYYYYRPQKVFQLIPFLKGNYNII